MYVMENIMIICSSKIHKEQSWLNTEVRNSEESSNNT